jgi:hypothetical protein
MGWETRGNRLYYYVKRRESGRVISDYIGGGALAEMLAAINELEQQERDLERRHWQAERLAELATDRQLQQIGRLLRDLQAATLIAHGCRTHRRQWRKKRDGTT